LGSKFRVGLNSELINIYLGTSSIQLFTQENLIHKQIAFAFVKFVRKGHQKRVEARALADVAEAYLLACVCA